MVAAHTKEGCCIDGADVMYFMNVNRFKNKTKKSTHNILSLFTAVFLHPDITIPVDWAKKKDQLLTYYCSFSMLYQHFIHLFTRIYYCHFSMLLSTFYSFIYPHLLLPFFQRAGQLTQGLQAASDSGSKASLSSQICGQKLVQGTADNTKHLYLQR